MTSLDKCPVCNGQELTPKLDCLDHTTSQETFTIVSCGTCDFTFTNPRPLDKKLGDYYKSDMYISHTNNTKGLFNWMYQTVRNYAIGTKVSLLKSIKKTGTHLDIGCGTGEFLNACKLAGFTTKGIEPSELARNQAINNHGLNISSNTDLSQYTDQEFDSISMWHVLEHVPNLNETIKQFDRLLKSDGKIIIAVPNHKSWDAKFYKEFWAAWDVPIHLWHFSKETIGQLFKNSNFSLEKTKPMIFDSFYVSLLSEEFKTGKKNFITGFIIGFISNLAGLFSKRGHSSTIYVFKKNN
ncbi:MAG: class I SAM-dependent methyltransferase [Flavobacteriales bacterium]|nr:class I SAM-dependent methyltransferase [Flavobacteriales bacterium]